MCPFTLIYQSGVHLRDRENTQITLLLWPVLLYFTKISLYCPKKNSYVVLENLFRFLFLHPSFAKWYISSHSYSKGVMKKSMLPYVTRITSNSCNVFVYSYLQICCPSPWQGKRTNHCYTVSKIPFNNSYPSVLKNILGPSRKLVPISLSSSQFCKMIC